MSRVRRGSLVATLLLLLLAAAVLVLQGWMGGDALRQRVEREATAALGVPVQIERVALTLWPLPGVALQGVALRTRQPLRAERNFLDPVKGRALSDHLGYEVQYELDWTAALARAGTPARRTASVAKEAR